MRRSEHIAKVRTRPACDVRETVASYGVIMAKVFVVSLAEGPLREGEIAGRVRSVDTDTEIVVHDSLELLAAMLEPFDAPASGLTLPD